MEEEAKNKQITRYALAAVAVLFGLVTLKAGGTVLFGGEEARQAAGDYVPFVLWFNFSAGFAYILAGVGIALGHAHARWIAALIATTSAIVFVALGVHIAQGGAYEMRTVMAMSLRTGLWAAIAWTLFRRSRPSALATP